MQGGCLAAYTASKSSINQGAKDVTSACIHLRKERIINFCKQRIRLVNLSFDV